MGFKGFVNTVPVDRSSGQHFSMGNFSNEKMLTQILWKKKIRVGYKTKYESNLVFVFVYMKKI